VEGFPSFFLALLCCWRGRPPLGRRTVRKAWRASKGNVAVTSLEGTHSYQQNHLSLSLLKTLLDGHTTSKSQDRISASVVVLVGCKNQE